MITLTAESSSQEYSAFYIFSSANLIFLAEVITYQVKLGYNGGGTNKGYKNGRTLSVVKVPTTRLGTLKVH